MLPNQSEPDEELTALFRRYHEACPVPELSPNFMPSLWQTIESRQAFSLLLARMASGFVLAAVTLSIAMAVYLYNPQHQSSPFYNHSYVEALAASYAADAPDYYEPVHFEPTLLPDGGNPR